MVSETAAEICGTCMLCRTGRYNLCPARKGFGYGVNGAMAQYVRVPARCLHHIPATLPFDIACLAEPHSVAYQVMCVNSNIAPGDFVVVVGPGPIGLLCTRMAALSGAGPLLVVGLSRDRPRLEAARRLGATHTVDIETENLADIVREISPDRRRPRVRCLGRELDARDRAEADEAGRSGLEGRMVARSHHHRRQSAGARQHSAPGLVQPQLSRVGTRHSTPRSRRDAPGNDRRAPLSTRGWREAFDSMHDGRVIKSVLLPGAS